MPNIRKALKWVFNFLLISDFALFVTFVITASMKLQNISVATLLSLVVAIIVTVTLAIQLCCLEIQNTKVSAGNGDPEKMGNSLVKLVETPRDFSFHELDLATDKFRQELGNGGSASVYEGNLNGIKVAVKRLNLPGGVIRKVFSAEVKTIGAIHHFNLVKLVGYCAESTDKLLVYEYMCNGSLEKWIFNQTEESALDWQTRKKIIMGIAKGLSYIHSDCRQKIIHLDIKPQNILLDGKFNARLADFGLARLFDRDKSHLTATMNGTPGYWAPEWFSNNKKITEKADVYSFGIVLLEIICGRKNIDRSLSETLLELVKKKAEGNQLFDVIDKSDDMQQHKEEAVKMVRAAIWCLQYDPCRRPPMSTVFNVLENGAAMEGISDYSFLTLPSIRRSYSSPRLPVTLSGPR